MVMIGRLNMVKMQALFVWLVEIWKASLTFIWKCKVPGMAMASSKENSKAGRVMPPDSNMYFRVTY